MDNREVTNGIMKSKEDHQVWSQVIIDFQNEFGNSIYRAWISNIKLLSLGEFEIIMSVPTTFIRDWIQREYFSGKFKKINGEDVCVKNGIRQILLKYFPKLMSFNIVVDKDMSIQTTQNDNLNVVESISENKNLYNVGVELNENYTFENFVVGQSNKLAYQVCKTIIDNDKIDLNINPLFLYGGVGIGKTHLCQAIAWKLKEKNNDKKIVYLTAEKFMFLFVQSLQNQDINNFKNKFRNIDVLIIDDIQFIIGKNKTQKEFFYTFETLINDNKLVIMACDRSPINMESLDEKLKSRIGGGLIVDIKEPDYQLRLDIVKKKSDDLGLDLMDDLKKFISEKITGSCREIEGCLKRLQINQDIMNIKITRNDIESILFDNIDKNQKLLTVNIIQEKVAEYFSISIKDLKSEKRLNSLITPRHIAMYLSKKLTNKSFPEIIKYFDGKSHATVMHAVKKIKKLLESDCEIAKIVEEINNALQ
jgi:chromosomal replication initiator protein